MKMRPFNMIEVLLALAITAVGITGLMGIIPLGLNANRDAMAETFTADIANSYFAQLSRDNARAPSFSDFYGSWEEDGKVHGIFFPPSSKSTKTVNGKTYGFYANPVTPSTRIPGPADLDENGINWKTASGTGGSYLEIRVGKKGNNVLPDFEADLCGWKCCPDDIPDVDNVDSDDPGKRNLIRVYLEVSWPVTAAYSKREKRIFVREFYDWR